MREGGEVSLDSTRRRNRGRGVELTQPSSQQNRKIVGLTRVTMRVPGIWKRAYATDDEEETSEGRVSGGRKNDAGKRIERTGVAGR